MRQAALRARRRLKFKFDGVSVRPHAVDTADDGDATVSAVVGSGSASMAAAAAAAGSERGSGMSTGCASGDDACTDAARASESATASANGLVLLSGSSAAAGDDTAMSINVAGTRTFQ